MPPRTTTSRPVSRSPVVVFCLMMLFLVMFAALSSGKRRPSSTSNTMPHSSTPRPQQATSDLRGVPTQARPRSTEGSVAALQLLHGRSDPKRGAESKDDKFAVGQVSARRHRWDSVNEHHRVRKILLRGWMKEKANRSKEQPRSRWAALAHV